MRQTIATIIRPGRATVMAISLTAVILGGLGAFALGFSFLATGSGMTVVTGGASHADVAFVALCVGDQLVFQKFTVGNEINGGTCPFGQQNKVAEVTRESGASFLGGWLAVIVSTLLQVYLITRPPLPGVFG
jgi:hypothetical protein